MKKGVLLLDKNKLSNIFQKLTKFYLKKKKKIISFPFSYGGLILFIKLRLMTFECNAQILTYFLHF